MNPPTPEAIPFLCGQCGHCCTHWRVPLEAAKVEGLLQKPWVQAHLQTLNLTTQLSQWEAIEASSQPQEASIKGVGQWLAALLKQGWQVLNRETSAPEPWGYWLPQTPNRVCAFFKEGAGCLIHHHQGAAAKPMDCQRFPFAQFQVSLPNGEVHTHTEATAACSVIAAERVPQWQQAAAQGVEQTALSRPYTSPFQSSPLPLHKGLLRFAWEALLPSRYRLSWSHWQERLQLLRQLHYAQPSLPLTGWLQAAESILLSSPHSSGGLSWQGFCLLHRLPSNAFAGQVAGQALWVAWQLPSLLPYGLWDVGRLLSKGCYNNALIFERPYRVSWQGWLAYMASEAVQQQGKAFHWHLLSRSVGLSTGLRLKQHLQGCKAGLALFLAFSYLLYHNETLSLEEASLMATRLVERYATAHQPRFWLLF